LFNHILDTGCFPKSWSQGVVISVFKKGDSSEPTNYRGITLISCFAKLFTVVIIERLKKWVDTNDILTDAQYCFKFNYSTVDAIFLLHAFIERQLNQKKKLYCCLLILCNALILFTEMPYG
jgi:hypothetical protein